MNQSQYAVVKDAGVFSFTKFHDTLDEAKAEAIRLAEKEQREFLVLKLVGYADVKINPIEWVEVGGEG